VSANSLEPIDVDVCRTRFARLGRTGSAPQLECCQRTFQELAYGGLKPEIVRRLEQLGEQLDGGNIAIRKVRGSDQPIAGTRLLRAYQGVEHTVTVMQDGYEWQGRPYKSLSAIARAITGTRWNGLVFFGLKNRRAAA